MLKVERYGLLTMLIASLNINSFSYEFLICNIFRSNFFIQTINADAITKNINIAFLGHIVSPLTFIVHVIIVLKMIFNFFFNYNYQVVSKRLIL